MPIYGFACPAGHEVEGVFGMEEVPTTVPCPEHGGECARVFYAPHFQEDRVRFHRAGPGAPTERWSYALGQDMPDSRAERRRIEKEKGIEFVSKADVMADPDMRKSLDYVQHLRAGGAPIDPKVMDAPKKLPKGILAKKLAEKGVRLGDYSREYTPKTREQVEREAAARGWVEAEATVAAPEKVAP